MSNLAGCSLQQQKAFTHNPRKLGRNNWASASECNASFRCGIGFGYRIKFAMSWRGYTDHGKFYAATAWPIASRRKVHCREIRWRAVVVGRGVLALREVAQRLRVAD